MTSSPHGPYGLGHTRATMAITMGSKAVRRSESGKIASVRIVMGVVASQVDHHDHTYRLVDLCLKGPMPAKRGKCEIMYLVVSWTVPPLL